MRAMKLFVILLIIGASALVGPFSLAQGQDYAGNEDPNKKILKQGRLGAGVGAISAEASGGKAGTGALVGAGTNVIGGALLDTLTSSPKPAQQQVQYVQQQPVYQQAPQYQQQAYPVQPQVQYQRVEPVAQPVYYQQAPPQENPNNKILKQGLFPRALRAARPARAL
jgi:hypothetical protein